MFNFESLNRPALLISKRSAWMASLESDISQDVMKMGALGSPWE